MNDRGKPVLDLLAESPLGRRLRDFPIAYFHATIEGVSHIPRAGGALLVGNHAMGGLDASVNRRS